MSEGGGGGPALWGWGAGAGIVVTLVTVTSALFDMFDVSVPEIAGRAQRAVSSAVTGESPVKMSSADAAAPAMPPPVDEPVAPAEPTPAAEMLAPQVGSITTEVAEINGRMMRLFHIGWTGPPSASLQFDARHFYLLKFQRRGTQCVIAVPAIHAWSQPTNTEDATGRRADRMLALRLPDERSDVRDLAVKLGLRNAAIEECTAVAARIEMSSGDDIVVQRAQCETAPYEDISRASWNYVSSAHERARQEGVAIRTNGLHAPVSDVRRMRGQLSRNRYCRDGATDPAGQLETGLGGA